MARVPPNHKLDEYWVLRCRIQRKIDQLVRRAGLVKVTQLIDNKGIF